MKVGLSLKRNIGKNLLLFIITLILGTVITGIILMSQAVANTEASLRRNLPPIVTIEANLLDYFNPYDSSFELEPVTFQMLDEIASLPYVSDMDHSFHSFGWESPVESSLAVVTSVYFPEFDLSLTTQHIRRSDFIDLNSGLISLVVGRTFSDTELIERRDVFPILISNEFAQLNNLSEGEIFSFDHVIRGDRTEDGTTWGIEEVGRLHFEFEVIGIFEIADKIIAGSSWENDYSRLTLLNRFYTPTWVSVVVNEQVDIFLYERYDWWELTESFEGEFWIQLAIMLYDTAYMEVFEERADEILPPYIGIGTLSNIFGPLEVTSQNMQRLSEMMVIFVIIVSVVVLGLVIIMGMRERRYEIGVYLALGEKRTRLVIQLMLEVLIIGTLAVTLSLVIGNVLAANFSENFIVNQMFEQEQHLANISFVPVFESLHWFSPGNLSLEEMIANYEVVLTTETAFMFYGVSMAVLIVASIVPTVYLFKFSTHKILLMKNE